MSSKYGTSANKESIPSKKKKTNTGAPSYIIHLWPHTIKVPTGTSTNQERPNHFGLFFSLTPIPIHVVHVWTTFFLFEEPSESRVIAIKSEGTTALNAANAPES